MRSFITVSCVLLGVAGCGLNQATSREVADDEGTAHESITFEEFKARHAFREPRTGVWISDGDSPFASEKLLREFYEKSTGQRLIVNQVAGQDDAWDAVTRHELSYCISDGFGERKPAVVEAMRSAADAWMAVANIHFLYRPAEDAACSTLSGVVFDVQPVSGMPYIARAFFPSSPRSAREVLIDDSAFNPQAAYTLTGVLRHELGHTLGFRHEHTRPETGVCFENSEWRALTPYDQASVMHYPQCNGISSWALELTPRDEEGAALLYGAYSDGDGGVDDGGVDDGGIDDGGVRDAGVADGGVRDGGVGDGGTHDGGVGDGGIPGPRVEHFAGTVAKQEWSPVHSFLVQPGTQFRAQLSGVGGDAELYVRYGSAPTATAYNCRPYLDDSNEECLLTVPAQESIVVVRVAGATRSTYALDVTYTGRTSTMLPGETCATAEPIATDGSRRHGNMNGYMRDGTQCFSSLPERYYIFTLAKRSVVSLTMSITQGANLWPFFIGPASPNTCGSAPSICYDMHPLLEPGTYYLVIAGTTPDNIYGTGGYDLTLTANSAQPTAESCSSPSEIELGGNAIVEGTTRGLVDDRSGTCGGGLADATYAVITTRPGRLTATVKSLTSTFRPVVYLQSTCSNSGNLACQAAPRGVDTVSVSADDVQPGITYVWVDGIGSAGGTDGDFRMTLTLE